MENIILISLEKEELVEIIKDALIAVQPTTQTDLLTAKEAAELLNIHISTLSRWMKSGVIPFKRLGKRIYFNRQHVFDSLQTPRGLR